jgi:transposase
MPWLETVPVEQRARFIDDHWLGLYDMTELCARYAISRKTGYKWLARYDAGGRPALQDRSRAPHTCPHKIAAPVEALLVAARRQHPDWGPEKLVQWLEPRHPAVTWPAISTAGDLLARHGLVQKRRRRRPNPHPGVVPPTTAAPNDLWATEDGPDRFGVSVQFLEAGAQRMRQATAAHLGRPLAILIDGEVVAAPVVRSEIGHAAVISGDFTRADAERIADGIGVH